MDDDQIESILYICREVSVYKIPPLKQNEGHRAQDWGDLASPLWKGRLRILEKGTEVALMFEDSTTGDLFAKAPYDPAKPCVEAVLDSSRYFVIRVEDTGRKAFIGMGFVERSDSFDFNVALQDCTKRWRASLNPPSPTSAGASPHLPAGPKKDFTLKEGQTFAIAIPGRSRPEAGSSLSSDLLGGGATATKVGGGMMPLLPPPPSAPKRK